MKLEQVNVRDPYILNDGDKYYLYGTRSATCWSKADGFDVYVSDDLEEWEGPIEIFRKSEDFPFDMFYWAPECYHIGDRYYFITTFGSETIKKGAYILSSDKPTGPFTMYSGRLTPEDWTCIDFTLYQKKETGRNYLIFSHSFEDEGVLNGDMCMIELSEDLKEAVSDPVVLFDAAGAPWAVPVPFAKAEFGIEGDCYFTDGPSVIERADGHLSILWSSWGPRGYAIGEAVSYSGEIWGPWRHLEKPFFPADGGHGMAFRDKEDKLRYVLHYPNEKYKEHPIFVEIEE